MKKYLSVFLCAVVTFSAIVFPANAAVQTSDMPTSAAVEDTPEGIRTALISAVLNVESEWTNGMADTIQFIDLNFDGRPEFVVKDYYPSGQVRVYQLDNSSLSRFNFSFGDDDKLSNVGETDTFKAMFDNSTAKYRMFGTYHQHNVSDPYYHEYENAEIVFDGKNLESNIYSVVHYNGYDFGTDNNSFVYYDGDKKSITKSEYDTLNRRKKENCVDANMTYNSYTMQYDHSGNTVTSNFSKMSSSEKRTTLEGLYNSFSYDKQEPDNALDYTAYDLLRKPVSEIIDIMGGNYEIDGFIQHKIDHRTNHEWKQIYIYNNELLPGLRVYLPKSLVNENSFGTDGRVTDSTKESLRQKLSSVSEKPQILMATNGAKVDNNISSDMNYNDLTKYYGDFDCVAADNLYGYLLTNDTGDIIGEFSFDSAGLTSDTKSATMKANNPKLDYVVLFPEYEPADIHGDSGTLGDFDYTKDGWSFVNGEISFAAFDKSGNQLPYSIPPARYIDVFGEDYYIIAKLNGDDVYNSMIPQTWGGNCFGMSCTASLFNEEILEWASYDQDKYAYLNAYRDGIHDINYTSFKTSGNISEITKLIERYQVWLKSTDYKGNFNFDNYYTENTAETENGTLTECRHNDNGTYIHNLFSTVQNATHPIGVFIAYTEDNKDVSHALLAYRWEKEDWSKESQQGWYKLYVYDPNYPYLRTDGWDFVNNRTYGKCYTTEERYVELNPSENKWRYRDAATTSNKESDIRGCDLSGNVILGSYTDTDHGITNIVRGIPDRIAVYDYTQNAPYRFDGKSKSRYLEENGTRLIVSPKSSIKITDTSDNIICYATNSNVYTLDKNIFYYSDVNDIDELNNSYVSNTYINLPYSEFNVTYYSGDDISLIDSDSIVNLKFSGDADIHVNMDDNKAQIISRSDSTANVKISNVSENIGFTSTFATGNLKNGNTLLLEFNDNNYLTAEINDNSNLAKIDVFSNTNSSTSYTYIETLSGNKTFQTKVKDQPESNNENTTQTKSPNTATTGNTGNTTSPANETVSNVTTGDSTNACMIAIIFGLSMIVILITVRRKKIIFKN